jgi:hypothetical protein
MQFMLAAVPYALAVNPLSRSAGLRETKIVNRQSTHPAKYTTK